MGMDMDLRLFLSHLTVLFNDMVPGTERRIALHMQRLIFGETYRISHYSVAEER